MKNEAFKIFVSEKLGSVSAEVCEPEEMKVMMTLAHGAGAGMHHSFLKKLAEDLAEQGIGTLRFNLHYMEHGKKRPDMPVVAHSVIRAVIEDTLKRYPQAPVVCSGKSFGGRMTSQLLSKEKIDGVRAIVFYGFPLHPAGVPGIERADHLKSVEIPMLFLQGTKDSLAELSLIKDVVNGLSNATLETIENADHSFKVGKKDAIVDLSRKTESWLRQGNIL